MDGDAPGLNGIRLASDETLLWTGRPAAVTLALRKAPLSLGGMALLAVPAYLILTLSSGNPLFAVPFFLLFSIIALFVAAAPLRAYLQARRTTYAVTDQRLLIADGRELCGFSPTDIRQLELREDAKSIGDVLFAIEPGGLARKFLAGPSRRRIGFRAVDGADAVLTIVTDWFVAWRNATEQDTREMTNQKLGISFQIPNAFPTRCEQSDMDFPGILARIFAEQRENESHEKKEPDDWDSLHLHLPARTSILLLAHNSCPQLEDLRHRIETDLKQFRGTVVYARRGLAVNGALGYELHYSMPVGLRFRHSFFYGARHCFSLVFASPHQTFDLYRPIFDQIVRSLRFDITGSQVISPMTQGAKPAAADVAL